MRITIERLRTLVLVVGGLLILALVAFLALGRWKRHFNVSEIPKRLGVDIKQEAHEIVYTQSRGGHTLFKIRASKEVQLKQSGRVLLHNVQIELYGEDGSRVDRISGNEFEYDQKAGTATAAGPVEIAIMQPHVAPAIAPNAAERKLSKSTDSLASMKQGATAGKIDVRTSGLTFDQKSGKAVTAQPVEFSTVQGSGSSLGATFDSTAGELILEHAVELKVHRGDEIVSLQATHAELERNSLICRLREATANFRGGDASAAQAQVLFRQDGSVVRLDARDGFAMKSATGTRVKSPTGWLEFNEQNAPVRGRMEGGVALESAREGRQMQGSAPAADLTFDSAGELRRAHLERGVQFHSEQQSNAKNGLVRSTRDWRSPVLDVDFRHSYANKVELSSMRGTGGVVVTGQAQQAGGLVLPSRMSADTVTGEFGDGQLLTRLVGEGHASLEQTTKTGVHQTTSGDRLEAWFEQGRDRAAGGISDKHPTPQGETGTQIQSAVVDGHVVFTQQTAPKVGEQAQSFRATAAHAQYEGSGEVVHLTGNPRIEEDGFQLSADRMDVSQAEGDAFAHGNVKATWFSTQKAGAQTGIALGGQGPGHVVAKEAQFRQATGEATFRGQVRMWQQANSIMAPVIVLNRTRRTLMAYGRGSTDPVKMILLTTANATPGKSRKGSPAVIQVKAGDLKYSEAERKAVLNAGTFGAVVADTGAATVSSREADLQLLPPGNHAGENGGAAQVDKMTARGHVVVSSGKRQGTGEKLIYSSDSGEYVLTGTAGAPPRLTDPAHGTVTGSSLIFSSRDDSVRIEGDGSRTTTETTVSR